MFVNVIKHGVRAKEFTYLSKLVYIPVHTVHEFYYPVAIEEVNDVGLASTIGPLPVGRGHQTHHATSAYQRSSIRSLLQKRERKTRLKVCSGN